jgi:catechol 2,3-dioxygenase-like lactoylglutathione lyase family enzyme
MLEHVDRVQIAVSDLDRAAETFREVFAAEHVRDDELRIAGAKRRVMHAGRSEFELLAAAGDGPVRRYLDAWGEGLFAAGFSARDVPALAERLRQRSIVFTQEGDQLFIEPNQTPGLRIVISPHVDRPSVGLVGYLYEVTNLVDDHERAARFYADTFGLDATRFSPIVSRRYGYTGQLTLFNPPDRLSRIELSQITDWERPMGRFMKRRGGETLYMCFIEAEEIEAIVERAKARDMRFVGHDRDGGFSEGLFFHPSTLHGVLMGVSRTNVAWTWSGRPELAPAGVTRHE